MYSEIVAIEIFEKKFLEFHSLWGNILIIIK